MQITYLEAHSEYLERVLGVNYVPHDQYPVRAGDTHRRKSSKFHSWKTGNSFTTYFSDTCIICNLSALTELSADTKAQIKVAIGS